MIRSLARAGGKATGALTAAAARFPLAMSQAAVRAVPAMRPAAATQLPLRMPAVPACVTAMPRACFSSAERVVIPESEYAAAAASRGSAPGADGAWDDVELRREAPAHLRNVKFDGSTRRFYDEVSITPEGDGRYALRLGGHIVMTPEDKPLLLPNKHYALLVALEFENQTTYVYPHTMPLTWLAVSVYDRVPRDRAEMTENVLGILKFDATLYRGENEDSPGLAKLQEKYWDPLLEHVAAEYGARFQTTHGIVQVRQPHTSEETVRSVVAALDDWRFAAFESVTVLGKSAIIALAFLDGKATVDEAFKAIRLEENFQLSVSGRVEGVYGTDIAEEHAKLRLASLRTAMSLLDTKLP